MLVSIFLRGGADGLSLVVPYADPHYRKARRGGLAVPPPGKPGGAIALAGGHGLHPGLKAIEPLFREKRLALVHAVGRPRPTRSHFAEQDVFDTGVLANSPLTDGWINRHLAQVEPAGPVRGICFGSRLARSLRGAVPVLAVSDLSSVALSGGSRGRASLAMLERLYGRARDDLEAAGRSALEAIRALSRVDPAAYVPAAGVVYPQGAFGRRLRQAAQIIKSDLGVEVISCDLGGWDTHERQLRRLESLTRTMGDGLAAFARDLGPDLDRVVVVVMSEFGRTLQANNTGGTDHGRACAAFVLGGAVRGGRFHGRWPGLDKVHLHKGRELAWTTDFRGILHEVVTRHLGNPRPEKVFPAFKPGPQSLFSS